MDIEIGSNLYRNSNGTIEIEGVPQIEVAPTSINRGSPGELCTVRLERPTVGKDG